MIAPIRTSLISAPCSFARRARVRLSFSSGGFGIAAVCLRRLREHPPHGQLNLPPTAPLHRGRRRLENLKFISIAPWLQSPRFLDQLGRNHGVPPHIARRIIFDTSAPIIANGSASTDRMRAPKAPALFSTCFDKSPKAGSSGVHIHADVQVHRGPGKRPDWKSRAFRVSTPNFFACSRPMMLRVRIAGPGPGAPRPPRAHNPRERPRHGSAVRLRNPRTDRVKHRIPEGDMTARGRILGDDRWGPPYVPARENRTVRKKPRWLQRRMRILSKSPCPSSSLISPMSSTRDVGTELKATFAAILP